VSVIPNNANTTKGYEGKALPPANSLTYPQPQLNKSYTETKYRWNRENYSRSRRSFDIWAFVLTLLTRSWIDGKSWSYPGGMTEAKKADRRISEAIWVRETFLQLGPTFIKVGQLFSTRADLFPTEYVEELSKLQDRVPAFSYEQVEQIITQDVGKKINQLYAYFDPVPLAAASLGQVHKAKLHTGEEVVVKVQRPGLAKLFTIDLAILKGVTKFIQNTFEWAKGKDWNGIYEECCRILWEEIDYLNEGQNADTFRRNFREYNWVKVPRVYWRYTSPRVLTLEYMPGIKISHYEAIEAAGLDRKQLAAINAKAYLVQVLNSGFFHADPHPGNIAVSPDGGLIFYDFGMMGNITLTVKQQLMDTLFGIAQKDADRIVNSLIELGTLVQGEEENAVRRSVQYMLDNFMDRPFEEQSVNAITDDLYEIAYNNPFRFPATFTFVMRAFSTLEGVGKGLDPDFNFMAIAQPFALELMANNNGNYNTGFLSELGRQAAEAGSTAFTLPRRIEDTIEKLERGDIRVRVRSTETDRILRRLTGVQLLTNYTLLFSTFTISATILFVTNHPWLALVAGVLAGVLAVVLFRLLLRKDRFDRMF
jgi:predicted unusual protein kinase regulating ubiquinone biosynthesis (AarF/ABC1/UbiB family)